MSKLYKKYVLLKIQDSSKLYLFEVGLFYLFIDEDAKLMSEILGLKLSKLNSIVYKCGFPVNASNKYFNLLKYLDYDIEVIPANDSLPSVNVQKHIEIQMLCNIRKDFLNINLDNISISQAFNLLYELQNKFKQIEIEVNDEKEKLVLNKKTRIYKNSNNFIFLGRKSNGNYARYRDVKRKIKRRLYLYNIGKLKLTGLINSIICYDYLCKKGSNY